MPRRAAPPKKKITGDPVYGSVLVQQVINKIMLDGKKSTAEKIVYDALSFYRGADRLEPGYGPQQRPGQHPAAPRGQEPRGSARPTRCRSR